MIVEPTNNRLDKIDKIRSTVSEYEPVADVIHSNNASSSLVQYQMSFY